MSSSSSGYGHNSCVEDQSGGRSTRRCRCRLRKLIAERFGLNLTVVNRAVDPTFRFMTVDWDGQIRMDLFSPYAMQRLIRFAYNSYASPNFTRIHFSSTLNLYKRTPNTSSTATIPRHSPITIAETMIAKRSPV